MALPRRLSFNIVPQAIWNSTWSPMVGAWLASIVIVLALAILLGRYDGKPYTSWTFSITLNAVVSLLATLMFIFIMSSVSLCLGQLRWSHFRSPQPIRDLDAFDGASRSALGGLKLMLEARGKYVTTFRTRIRRFSHVWWLTRRGV